MFESGGKTWIFAEVFIDVFGNKSVLDERY
jgi:hypothetical protein